MKPQATESNTKSRSSTRRSRYHKVLDNRKHAIRGLWRRNGMFVARLKVEELDGQKKLKWATLAATTAAEAVEEMKTLHVERRENRLRHIGRAPKLADYITAYTESLTASGKRQATIDKETGCLSRWSEKLGELRLDLLRPTHLQGFLDGLKNDGYSGRTANLYLIALRHVLKRAKRDGYLKVLPSADIAWQKSDTKKRGLVSPAELDTICAAALKSSKNGLQLVDYLRLMAFSGTRRNEALALRWSDVDFDRRLLTVGSDGTTKNRKPRHVDFTPALETHLRNMHSRRAPDSQWVFPSPQRGEKDIPAHTFMESLRLARKLLPDSLKHVGFHDMRHFFISFCVMAGVPPMTIAAWVGHLDGGVLIGKVYGHLNDEHKRAQAARVVFAPVVLPTEQAANG